MNRLSFVLITLIVLSSFGFTNNARADQNSSPPLLMQQSAPQVVPPPVANAPVPFGQAIAPGNPLSPPPGPAGIPVFQTIPMQTLLANLPQAIITAEKLNKLFSPGKIWTMNTPQGETEIKGGLLYKGVVVAVLHFNPMDGSILPLGINPQTYQNSIGINSIKSALPAVINNLKILQAAEFMGPEADWSFPVTMGNKIVAHIKIYYDGIHVVEDYAANQEMNFYGQ